jgi:hypothetical protein
VPLTEFFINGVAIAPAKSRVLYGVHRNEEWLFDLTAHVHRGENIVAIGFAAATNEFDLDAFVVPCVDDEWYF